MEKIFFEKFKTVFVVILVNLTLSCILIISIFFALAAINKLNNQAQILEKKVQNYGSILRTDIDETVKFQQKLKRDLKDKYVWLKGIFSDHPLADDYVRPLYFKERLFDFQEKMKEKAQSLNVTLPESLGFADYAQDVPDSLQLQVLMQELILAEDVINELLKMPISSIVDIKLEHSSKPAHKSDRGKSVMSFDIFSIAVSFKANFKQIKKFLEGVSEKKKVYLVKILNIEKSDDQKYLFAKVKIDFLKLAGGR